MAMVPVLLILCRRLGYDALTAAAMSIGAASVGSAFSPVNPFQAVLAQHLADLPPSSGAGYRTVFLLLALGLWIGGTMRHAARSRVPAPEADTGDAPPSVAATGAAGGARTVIILSLVGVAFAGFIYGALFLKWDFDQMAAVFFLMGVAAGLVGRLGFDGTAEAFVEGFRSMAFAAILIGFARAIFVVLDEGRVVDTLVAALFTPLGHLPVGVSAVGMVARTNAAAFPGAERERSGRVDHAGAGAAGGPARDVAAGGGACVPIRRGNLRTHHADQRRADGDPRGVSGCGSRSG